MSALNVLEELGTLLMDLFRGLVGAHGAGMFSGVFKDQFGLEASFGIGSLP